MNDRVKVLVDVTNPTEWQSIESAPDHEWVMVAYEMDGKTITEPAIRGWEEGEDANDVSNIPKCGGWLTTDCLRIFPVAWRPLKEGE